MPITPRVEETPEERDLRIASRFETDTERLARIANLADAARLPFQPDLAAIEAAICEACPPDLAKGDHVNFTVRRRSQYWHVQAGMVRDRCLITAGVDITLDLFEQWPEQYAALAAELAKNYARAMGSPWLPKVQPDQLPG